MNRCKLLLLAILLSFSLVVGATTTFASPSDVRAAKLQFKKMTRLQKKEAKALKKALRKLSEAELKKLKRSVRGKDSDGDGVPDIIEDSRPGSNKCDADSDDDGIDDDEDYKEGDSDSDDDGIIDGNEFEREGRVASFSDPVLVIGGTTYQLTDSTIFRYKFGDFGRGDITAGLCVEVEGYINDEDPSSNIVQKVKRKKDSSCTNDGDDDGNDDDD